MENAQLDAFKRRLEKIDKPLSENSGMFSELGRGLLGLATYGQPKIAQDVAQGIGETVGDIFSPDLAWAAGAALKLKKIANHEGSLSKYFTPQEIKFIKSSPAEFKLAIDEAIKKNPEIEKYVSHYTPSQMGEANMELYLSGDKASGYGIKPTERRPELINVFSSEKGRGSDIVKDFKNTVNEPSQLDAYDGYLTKKLYPEHGFKEVKKEPNWTPGGPDVVYMDHNPYSESLLDADNLIPFADALKNRKLAQDQK